MKLPQRKRNRIAEYDYSTPGFYFVTVCSMDKENLFWQRGTLIDDHPVLTPAGEAVRQCIQAIPIHHPTVRVDQFNIMPNHVHLILEVTQPNAASISIVIGQMKRSASLLCPKSIWQKSYHDHVIRNEADYQRIWVYVVNNHWKWRDDCYYVP